MSVLKSKSTFKRILSITITSALLASCVFAGQASAEGADTTVTAVDSHAVVSDAATNKDNWKVLSGSTTVVSNDEATGNVSFNFVSATSQRTNTVYIDADNTLNQRVKASYVYSGTLGAENNALITLFARLRFLESAPQNLMAYAAQVQILGSDTVVTVSKYTYDADGTWKANVVLGRIRVPNTSVIANGATTSVEMVVTGTNSTNITVNLYKNTTLAATTAVIDNDEYLQQAGTVGLTCLPKSTTPPVLTLSTFDYTTTDNVAGNNFLGHWSSSANTLYQRLPLKAGKTYIVDALVTEDSSYSYAAKPFVVNLVTGTALTTSNLTPIEVETVTDNTKAPFIDEFSHYVGKFTVPSDINLNRIASYAVDAAGNYLAIVNVGLDLSTAKSLYGNVRIYAEDDEGQNNLFVNGDFKMGLYGWIEGAGTGFCYYAPASPAMTEGASATSGVSQLRENRSNFQFYNLFKNGYIPEKDANLDGTFDIRDLVRAKKIIANGGYIGVLEHSQYKDSVLNAQDLAEVRQWLLNG